MIVLETKLSFSACGGIFFGLYTKEKIGVSHYNIYFESNDISIATKEHPQVMDSLLKILKGDCDVNSGIQEDIIYCDLRILLTTFRRARGFQDSAGKLTVEDLQKK